MRRWWERWPATLQQELDAFVERGLRFARNEQEWNEGRLVLRGALQLSPGRDEELVVVYPETYPYTRCAVFAPKLRLKRHQNPLGGNLCLLPQAGIHWRPRYRAADFVADDVPRLVHLVESGGPAMTAAEDPQGEPYSGYLSFSQVGGIVVPEAALEIPESALRGVAHLRFESDQGWLRALRQGDAHPPTAFGKALLCKVTDSSGAVLAEAEPALLSQFPGASVYKAVWARIEVEPHCSLDEFSRLLWPVMPARASRGIENVDFCGVVFKEEVHQGVWADTWVFAARPNKKRLPGDRLQLLRGMRLSPRQLTARIPELTPLANKTVTVLGLGALGAPIALDLGRAQVGMLRLVDPDYVDPATGPRWVSGFDGAGAWKTAYLRRELARTHPYVKVSEHRARIGDASVEVAGGSVDELFAGADLVIDATAEPYEISRAVAEMATEHGIPQIFTWSIDGYGGIVARVIPGKTGCLQCLLEALESRRIEPPPAALDPKVVRAQPRGCRDPTFTGSALELSPLSAQAARLGASMLCAGEAGAYPWIHEDVFVLSMRAPDGRLLTPTWKSYALPPSCSLCRPA